MHTAVTAKALLLVLLLPTLLFGQLKEEWSVPQPYWEWGHCFYDYNSDGVHEVTKQYLNTFFVYNGADSFKISWSLTANSHDELLIYDFTELKAGEGKRALFVANNTVDTITSRILCHKPMTANPEWQTTDLPGYYSYLSYGELDSIPGKDVAVGINQYVTASKSYRSKLYVFNGSSGKKVHESGWIAGYMVGPYVANIDKDGAEEIVLNLYFSADTTSAVRVYSFDEPANVLQEKQVPDGFSVSGAFPNPFNSTTSIPVTVPRSSNIEVEITDINGRTVAPLFSGTISAGNHRLMWNGTNMNGETVPSGSYFCRIRNGEREIVRPVVLVR